MTGGLLILLRMGKLGKVKTIWNIWYWYEHCVGSQLEVNEGIANNCEAAEMSHSVI